ncbi:hypothetical protein Tco_1196671, partial [Tanacetum coccineum]
GEGGVGGSVVVARDAWCGSVVGDDVGGGGRLQQLARTPPATAPENLREGGDGG